MADYAPWYWDWDDNGNLGGKAAKPHGPQPCAKDFQPDRGLNQAPPKGNGLPWTKFEQMEWIDPDMQTSAPNCKPVVYWVRCKSNQCKKPFSCIRTDIMVRLPNDNYVNDIKFVCKKSMTNALDVKKDDGKSKK